MFGFATLLFTLFVSAQRFPNARYLFSEKERAYWTAQNEIEPVQHLIDSVLPVIAAGRHLAGEYPKGT